MLVMVHLHTILQKPTEHGLVDRLQVELPEGARLADLIERLDIVLSPEALLLAVNGRMADPERELKDGDQVNLMPAISGGSILAPNKLGERFQPAHDDPESIRVGSHLGGGKETIG